MTQVLEQGAAASSLGSLIAASWNPLIERLKAIGSLRDLAVSGPN